ncbi:AAA family ATPase [Tumebacillus permanentifrigoris]|uniref:Putative ATPase n=1 Tax=Tumebacillus permanentifrigoris TaxID=378543 RepID=A0A316D4J5_9BACL|nr:AAA family ATPase [Tumebacillus permanentifrigoris]PWK04967.1 putative ATPase [Tumebacillus permanentifrigoris]
MFTVAEYQVQTQLHREKKTVLYRAQSQTAQGPVLIKTFQADYPAPQEILQLKREYEVTRRAVSPGVIAPLALEPYQHTWLLKLEDCGGETLEQVLTEGPMNLFLFLEIAIRLADAVLHLHRKNIIHKDIKPANILVNREQELVKLTNFASASLLSGERTDLVQPDLLEGSLPYMSPEQTGRLNRPTDFRSDLYALGVTFYEMLTGQRPFSAEDPVHLIYQHLSVEAVPPTVLNPLLPFTLSDLICKCLAKNAEDRYQSAYGLKYDLEKCLRQLTIGGRIEHFPVGEADRAEHFRIPDALYGREREIQTLCQAYERVCQGGYEGMLVIGAAGLGKSTLGQEFKRIVQQEHGFFLMGKFDKRKQAPYQGLLQALQQLVTHLLAQSDASIANWRERIQQAVGANLSLLTELLPALERIVGPQPPVSKASAVETNNRFRLALQNLLGVFAAEQHPVVMFLDDLQEADQASLKLLSFLLSDQSITHLLLIGSCRDDDLPDRWSNAVHTMREEGLVRDLLLDPLRSEHVAQMMRDTLRCTAEQAAWFAQVVMEKGGGNPLFIKEFLQSLYTQGHLCLEEETGEWRWDEQAILRMEVNANQVGFLVNKLTQLPMSTQQLVKAAACLGSSFDLLALQVVLEREMVEVAADLLWALEEGILLSKGTAYKWLYDIRDGCVEQECLDSLHISCEFLHDRVQQAAYGLLTEEERKRTHLQMGRWLWDREDRLFERVNHLNEALDWITAPDEREELAWLNLEAGRQLKTSTAYDQAISYIARGTDLLTDTCWETQYGLAYELYKERFELEYLCGQVEQAEAFFDQVVQRARTVLDKSAVYIIKILLYNFSDRMEEALRTGEEGLRVLGWKGKMHMSRAARMRAYKQLKWLVQNKPFAEMIDVPMATDPIVIAQVEMMNSMGVPSYHIDPMLFQALRIHMIESSLEHGLTEKTASAYVGVGVMVLTEFGDYETADALGRLGVEMEELMLSRKGVRAYRSLSFYANEIQRWTTHNRSVIDSLWTVSQLSLEAGELMRAVYTLADRAQRQVYGGVPLDELKQDLQKLMRMFERSKSEWTLYLIHIAFGLIHNLQGTTEGIANLSYEDFDEEHYRTEVLPNQAALWPTWYYFCKIFLLYLAGEYDAILQLIPEISEEVVQYESDLPFLFALTYTAVGQGESDKKLKHYRKQMKKWAAVCPDNFLHRSLLMEAEVARLAGHVRVAMDLYDQAIEAASRNGYLHHAAIANECAAKFYLNLGKPHLATSYLEAARYGYLQWGALVKARQLEVEHPVLLHMQNQQDQQTTNVDFLSVMKAARTISGEIVLEKLLEKLIEIVVENAGAQKVVFLMQSEDGLNVVAHKMPEEINVLVCNPTPWQSCVDVSPMIIQYVTRLQEAVVLHDAARDDVFGKCPYIRETEPKSVLCLPILNQGRTIGVIYLENNLMTHGFTEERLEVMNLLAAQTAVSIENAELYRRQVTLNHAYGRFVPHQFLRLLQKKSITDVNWGDHVEKDMSVLFADIRSFTTLSEQMTPEENFFFLNGFLRRMEPVIKEQGGFVDKYIGDSIMALFDRDADDAVRAGVAMLRQLQVYNETRAAEGREAVRLGIGVNSGHLMLGTIGGYERMDSTVISDAVNVAARIEKLTKTYNVPLLISEHTRERLKHPERFALRPIDHVSVRGRSAPVTLYEVFSADVPQRYSKKLRLQPLYEQAYQAYWAGSVEEARTLFAECLKRSPSDEILQMYVERCR